MKKLLIWLLFLPTLIMADAVIFSGSDVKALKQNLDLFGVVKVMSGTVDPSAGGGVAAPVGSAYLSTVHGLFLKTGASNTAWTKNALLPVDLATQVSGILATANGGTGSSNLGTGVVKASSGTLSTGTVDLTSNVNGILPVANGGTNLSTVPTNGQLLIGNGTNYTLSGLTGTANQVSVNNGSGSITLSTPQDIATTSNVQFANLSATGTTTLNSGLTGPLKASSGVVSSSAINLGTEVTGTLPIANGGTGSATKNFVDLTTNQTIAGEKTFSNTLKSDSIQTTGSSGVVIKNSSGTTVADFGPANTTNASIAGGLNVGGNVVATGTVTGSNLSGTNTGDLTTGGDNDTPATTATIVAPNKQLTLTGTNQYRLNTGNNNELDNANFEHSTVTTGWTVSNATSSGSTSALEGKKALSLALTGALSLSQSSTINAARKSGVQMVASIWVNSSDVSDLQLCSLKNGSEDKCTVSGGYVQGSGWRQLTVSFLGDATSNGLKLKSTDTTGTVLVDQAYVGIGSPVVDFTPDMVYSAKVSSTGVVSAESTDWISGNCVASGTNNALITCTFTTGIFTVAPNCTITNSTTVIAVVRLQGDPTSTQVVFVGEQSGSPQPNSYNVICQKQGADYKTSKAYVASGSDYGWTAFTPTSPNSSVTFSSSSCYHSRQGQNLLIRCYGVSTGTSAEARISLPNSLTSASNIPTIQIAGDVARLGFSSTYFRNVVLIEPSVSYLTFGRQDSTVGSLTKTTGALAFGSDTVSFTATVPIAGWENSSVIVGSFQGYNETPGTSRVETFSVSYGTTNSTTVCSASPCSYLDQIGNAVTSVTRSGTGDYALNASKTYSKLKCGWSGTGPNQSLIYSSIACSSCSSVSFSTVGRASGVGEDTRGTLLCQGIPQ